MKNLNLLLVLFMIFFNCSEEVKKTEPTIILNYCDSKDALCITIQNSTSKKIYLPEIRVLTAGLKLFSIDEKNVYNDITNKAIYYSLFRCGSEKEYQKIAECCYSTEYKEYLSEWEKDTIASDIVSKIKDARMAQKIKNWSIRKFDEMVFLKPDQVYTNYFPISDSIKSKRIAIFYSYPYPLINLGLTAEDYEQIEYNKKLVDTLHFEYPRNIKGYELFDMPLISKPLIINRN